MKLIEAAAAAALCLSVTIDGSEPRPVQSITVDPARKTMQIDGERVHYRMAVYRDCRLEVERSDVISRDRFEGRGR